MGYFAFFLILTAACLLWSAACTAAAARSARRRALWLFLGLALPVLALLPWLWASGWLAFDARMRPNWFGAVAHRRSLGARSVGSGSAAPV
jgi:hypothetical protein